jgi:hypothetical protein
MGQMNDEPKTEKIYDIGCRGITQRSLFADEDCISSEAGQEK